MSIAGTVSDRPDDGPLPGLLGTLADRIAVESIDSLWIFPTHRMGPIDSTVIVVSAFQDDTERRRVITARFSSRRERSGQLAVEHDFAEHGIAPADRIDRLIEGVLRRLTDDLAAAPLAARIIGDPARWAGLLGSFPSSRSDP